MHPDEAKCGLKTPCHELRSHWIGEGKPIRVDIEFHSTLGRLGFFKN